jgi:PAS domain S-box-containing protein
MTTIMEKEKTRAKLEPLQQRLKKLEEEHKYFIEKAPIGMFISTLQGEFIFINREAAKTLEFDTTEEMIQEGIPTRYKDLNDRTRILRQLKTTGKVKNFEFKVLTKTGKVKTLLLNAILKEDKIWGTATDITERKKTAEALFKARAQLRAAFDSSKTGILIADAPYVKIRYANAAAMDMRGKPAKERTNIPPRMHPSDWKVYKNDGTLFKQQELPLSQAILFGKTSRNVEAIIERANGKRRYVLANASPIKDASGNITGGIVIFSDITESKKVMNALVESEHKLREIFNQTFQYMALLSLEGILLMVNNAGLDLIGATQPVMIGKYFWDTPWWAHSIEIQDKIKKAIKYCSKGTSSRMELTTFDKHNKIHYIDALLRPVVIKKEGLKYLIAEGHDITDIKKAESALRESLETSSDIFRSIPSGLFIYQYEPPDKLILLDGNPAAARLTGIDINSWVGKEFNEIWPQATSGKDFYSETTEYKDEHTQGFFKIRTFKMPRNRIGVGFENITKQKHTEQEVDEYRKHLEKLVQARTAELKIAKEQAESADRTKSAFLATMSHELRSPLTSIIGFINVILQELSGPLTDKQNKQLNIIKSCSNYLLDLINNILDISKIEAEQLKTTKKTFNMAELINTIVATEKTTIKQHGLKIYIEIAPAVGNIVSD